MPRAPRPTSYHVGHVSPESDSDQRINLSQSQGEYPRLPTSEISASPKDFQSRLPTSELSASPKGFQSRLSTSELSVSPKDFQSRLSTSELLASPKDFQSRLSISELSASPKGFQSRLSTSELSASPKGFQSRLSTSEAHSPLLSPSATPSADIGDNRESAGVGICSPSSDADTFAFVQFPGSPIYGSSDAVPSSFFAASGGIWIFRK
ncbi:hypothetical protein B296_00025407 [Ensete ventricosum]|uniref:Uncharacterized protein n=1 Tax=Ensete ventricosum TaxID=4639 RepID=A0A426ZG43_ENSVE|nr:hypothetical protein B296_00025407 [Ensete ventricosum]